MSDTKINLSSNNLVVHIYQPQKAVLVNTEVCWHPFAENFQLR